LDSALLLTVASAYLVGAFVVIAALVRTLLSLFASWRTRRHAEPVDDALPLRAAEAMAAVAALANVAPPGTDVVAYLGTPRGDDAGTAGTAGDGGLAVTRFRVGWPATVVFAQAALTGLSWAAAQSLAAHELAHVIRRERSSAAARYGWLVGYLALMLAGTGLAVAALVAVPQLAGLALVATMSAAVALSASRVAVSRAAEEASARARCW
jgi:Zn-dependent protease with chaperone function